MDELLSEFVAETQESLEALANVAVALEADPSDRKLLDELFRFFHTVKGSCGFLNLPRFERLSHAAEDVLSDIRAGEGAPDAATITAVLAVMDRIAELCMAVDSGSSLPDTNDDELIEMLRHCHRMAGVAISAPEGLAVAADEVPIPQNGGAIRGAATSRTIRLPLTLIDQLMNGVSDMVLARNEVARKLRISDADPELETAFERLSGCIADMRDSISKTRMQRVERLFMAIPRMVRDLGRELGKSIDLVLEGGEVEMDREMVEMVVDPLTHIVRNAIDHGIEAPAQRREAGKPEIGSLVISARQSGSQIVIEVADDGRGINVDAVTNKVISAGLMTAQDVAQLNEQAKLDLIFTPALSTAQAITSISGRGVGMDIVRANVERIGGVISLANDPGRGLTITMRVPLTLTIIPGLILNAGGLNFAIPRTAVVEILHNNNPTVTVAELGGGLTATIRDMRYSMVDLEDVINIPKVDQIGPRSLMIVRSATGKPFILGVGTVENHEELVIRPAAPVVMAAGIYAGMTLPDNGQPMLLLDAGGIAQAAELPLIAEHVEREDRGVAAVGEATETFAALRFIELTGEERVIRLALVDRVEDIPAHCFSSVGGVSHVSVADRLVACAAHFEAANIPSDSKEVTCLRIRDGARELCYPIASIVDIHEIPATLDMSARYGVVAGVVLIEGHQVEAIDSLALLAGVHEPSDQREVASVRCVIADQADSWNREILAPLLVQAGYEVVWGHQSGASRPDDVLVLTSAEASPLEIQPDAVVRLRSKSQPGGPNDQSVYRYDRDALLSAISSAHERRGAA